MVAIESTTFEIPDEPAPRLGWRLRQVSFAAQQPQCTLEFEPGVNVLVTTPAGVHDTVWLLKQALHGGDGVHAEFLTADGQAYVVFRPVGAHHRLIELETGAELPMHALDVLAVDTPTEPDALEAEVELIHRLSLIDQEALWEMADRLMHGGPEHVEFRHAEIGTPAPRPVMPTADPSAEEARRGLLRRRSRAHTPTVDPTKILTDTASLWWWLAGRVDVPTVIAQRDRIETAAQLPGRLGALSAVGQAQHPRHTAAVDPADAIRAVCQLVPAGTEPAGPHIVTVPGSIDRDLALLLLERLPSLDLNRQIILVTADEAVVDWARLEGYARRVTLVEPRWANANQTLPF